MPDFKTLEPLNVPGPLTSSTPYIICNEQLQDVTLASLSTMGPPQTTTITTSSANLTKEDLKQEEDSNIKQLQLETSGSTGSEFNPPQSVHVGFSVWFNLDLLSVTQPDYAIILDIDKNVFHIYALIREAFKQAATPDEFVFNFMKQLEENPHLLETTPEHQKYVLQQQLKKGYGFLSSQKAYDAVKNMCNQGQIFFGSCDLTDPDQMGLIKKWCDENKMIVQTLYLSNIPEWISEHKAFQMPTFIKNIRQLIAPATAVIHAAYPTTEKTGSGPPQHVTWSKTPSFSKVIAKKKTMQKHVETGKFTSRKLFGSPKKTTPNPTSPTTPGVGRSPRKAYRSPSNSPKKERSPDLYKKTERLSPLPESEKYSNSLFNSPGKKNTLQHDQSSTPNVIKRKESEYDSDSDKDHPSTKRVAKKHKGINKRLF